MVPPHIRLCLEAPRERGEPFLLLNSASDLMLPSSNVLREKLVHAPVQKVHQGRWWEGSWGRADHPIQFYTRVLDT